MNNPPAPRPSSIVDNKVVYEKYKVKDYVPNVDKVLLHNKGLVLKAGSLYKFKIDPSVALSINFWKEHQFINKHYNEIYLKRIDKTSSIRSNIEKTFKGHIMFTGEIVNRVIKSFCNLSSASVTKYGTLYLGFLIDEQVFFLEEKTFWEQGLVELETNHTSLAE